MTLSQNIAALVSQAEALEAQAAAAAALQADFDTLMVLSQAYLDAPNGEDADEAAALAAFLASQP